ncbi:hypothetical protein PINS_up014299 [Pythium insidiosum]|nr:hypothetical protein PINS_up014299 [Pythium insidiosum]
MVHGDIKCNNILVAKDGHARLADFGMSFTRVNSATLSKKKQTGAMRWKAPECIEGENPTFASDWYAFGMCVLEAVSGRVPWANVVDEIVVVDNVRRGKLPPRPTNVSEDTWNLIAAMCKTDPKQRLTGKDALSKLRGLANNVLVDDEPMDAWTERRFSSRSNNQTDEIPTSPKSSSPQLSGTDMQKEFEPSCDDIPLLVENITTGTDAEKEHAAYILGKFACDVEVNQVKIAEAGGIPPLVQLIKYGTDMQKEHAAFALGNLAWDVEANRVKIAEAGDIPPLVQLIKYGTDMQKEHAAFALGNLACNVEVNRVKIAPACAGAQRRPRATRAWPSARCPQRAPSCRDTAPRSARKQT